MSILIDDDGTTVYGNNFWIDIESRTYRNSKVFKSVWLCQGDPDDATQIYIQPENIDNVIEALIKIKEILND
jgi:hypothetical protein